MSLGIVPDAAASRDRRRGERLFHRDLPGGGYVAIEIGESGNDSASPDERRVRVVVERRSQRARRAGHKPPVIIEVPWSADRGIEELYRVANDNVAIARGLLELRRVD